MTTLGEVYAPPARGDSGSWAALTATQHGRLFRKHLLNRGDLIHPKTGSVITIDQAFVDRLRDNFQHRVSGPVSLQLADAHNRHNDDPRNAIGEVVGIEDDGAKVHALLDVRRRSGDLGQTLLSCSANLHTDFVDTATRQRVGPALLHVLVTNRPYVADLDTYEPLPSPVTAGTRQPASLLALTNVLRAAQTKPATAAARVLEEAHVERLTALGAQLGLTRPSPRS